MSFQKCPVCGGNGTIIHYDYGSTVTNTAKQCNTCKGYGIINELTGLPPANEKPLEKKKIINLKSYPTIQSAIDSYLSGNDYDIDHFSLSKNQEELIKQMDSQPLQFDKAKIKEQAQQRNEACYPKTPKECFRPEIILDDENQKILKEYQSAIKVAKDEISYAQGEIDYSGTPKERVKALKDYKEYLLVFIEIIEKKIELFPILEKQQPLSSTNGQTEINKLQIAIEVLEEQYKIYVHSESQYTQSLLICLTSLKAKKDGLLKTKSNN